MDHKTSLFEALVCKVAGNMDSFQECWFHFKNIFQSTSIKLNDMTVIVRLCLSVFDVASLSYSHVKGDRQH